MLIRGVVQHQLGDHAQPPPVRLVEKVPKVMPRSISGVDIHIVGDVIDGVHERRLNFCAAAGLQFHVSVQTNCAFLKYLVRWVWSRSDGRKEHDLSQPGEALPFRASEVFGGFHTAAIHMPRKSMKVCC